MKAIVKFFLRAKHWQLFLLLVGMPGFGEMVGVAVMMAGVSSKGGVLTFGLALGSTELGILFLVGWFWAMGMFLNSTNQPSLELRTGFFRFALIYPVLYGCAFAAFFLNPGTSMFPIILPLHLFALFCLFYDLYFVSKILVMAETGKPATFNNYAGVFFLFWFFPAGIWFVQPRVNRLYAERKND